MKTKKEIEDACIALSNKYCDLVWYARKPNNLSDKPDGWDEQIYKGMRKEQKRIEDEQIDEVSKLLDCTDNWQHGFNSGMLACARYILTGLADGLEQADKEFPFLDS